MNSAAPNYSLLIVDDEKVIREGIQRLLAREAHRLTLVENGAQAWQLLQQETYDLVLLDLMMPEMNGLELLERLQEKDPERMVIIITGQATVELAVEAMKRGAYDIVTKPFTPDQLRLVVRRALEKRALQIEAEGLRREREKSLMDIATEKSRIQTIIHCMADGVLVTDQAENVALHNPALTHLLQLAPESLSGRPLPVLPGLEKMAEAIGRVLRESGPGGATISQEFSVQDTPPVFLRSHTAAVRGESGEVLGAVTVVQDITYLKIMDQMKSEFVAMVAHELRAPLAAIQQQIEVILQGLVGEVGPKPRELLLRAQERAEGLLELIRNLLDISKMEAGRHFQQKETLDPAAAVERVLALLTPQADAKGLALRFVAPKDLPLLSADPQGLEEVLTNLIHNAVKYTPEGGVVEVTLSPEAEYLRIQVADNGLGIAPEDLPRVFDKFFRVKNEETRRIVGTGLGLPIVKRIVEAHLGYLKVESQVNQGTTFTVLLPRTGQAPKECS
jgi:two-component system, OmpR family, phosphate regulon sensor histidine kinase PhoR